MTGDPPEDDVPQDLDEALERLAVDAEGLPRRPRPSAKTLVPWGRGAGALRPAAPPAPREPAASPPAPREETTMVGAPPPEPLPGLRRTPPGAAAFRPLRTALADTDPSAPQAAPPGLEPARPRAATSGGGLEQEEETGPRAATSVAGLDRDDLERAATSGGGLEEDVETGPRAATTGVGLEEDVETGPRAATSVAGLDPGAVDPRPLAAPPAPPEAPHRPISMAWSELVPSQPAPPGPDPHASLPPVAEAPYAIEVVGGPSAGLVVGVGRRSAMVGRVMGALRVEDPFVSDGHASFVVRLGQLVLVDGGGPSGVYVSARPVEVLQPGQYFAVGLQVFRFLGPVQGPGTPGTFGAPLPRGAYRLEHVLVGDRPGRVVLFGHSASIGRLQGTFQFPEDPSLEALHAELRPGRQGMELLTHGRQAPAFLRAPAGGDVPLQNGDLVRFGASTVRVVAR